eukprot:COSAG05_NODE_977_length_6332_cov_10.027755_8_plen_87_part_00
MDYHIDEFVFWVWQRATVELRRALRNATPSDNPGKLLSAIARTVARRPQPQLLIQVICGTLLPRVYSESMCVQWSECLCRLCCRRT